MGCGGSKSSMQVLQPKTPRDVMIETRLAPMLSPTHDLNVNKKYTYLIKLIPDQFTGEGIRKTPKYISLVSKEILEDKKVEFWGSLIRIESRGSETVLGSIKTSCIFERFG